MFCAAGVGYFDGIFGGFSGSFALGFVVGARVYCLDFLVLSRVSVCAGARERVVCG